MNTHELAWAAGFFDGEGTVSDDRAARHLSIGIGQVDVGPLQRFQEAVGGIGTIYGPTKRSTKPGREKWQDFYTYRVYKWTEVQAIIAMLWKFLSDPKRKQAIKVLAGFHAKPRKIKQPPLGANGLSNVCGKGHPRTPENTSIRANGNQVCLVCVRERTNARWANDPEWRASRLAKHAEWQRNNRDKVRANQRRYKERLRAKQESS